MKPRQSGHSPIDNSFSGPLIPREILAVFYDLVGRAFENTPDRCANIPIANLRPPLACIPDLLDQATEVLLGNPIAIQRFRELLKSLGSTNILTTSAARIYATHPDNKCSCHEVEKPDNKSEGGQDRRGQRKINKDKGLDSELAADDVSIIKPKFPLSHRAQRLVSMKRLEPILAAAVFAARDTDELAELVGGIQLGLTGIDQMNTLFDLALNGAEASAIASAFDTAVRVMSFAGFPPLADFTPREDWRPFPGFDPRFGLPWPRWPFPFPGSGGEPAPLEPPSPEAPLLDTSLTEHFEHCMIFEIIPELHRMDIGFREFLSGVGTDYRIDSVEPDNACPGDLITIAGENFDGVVAVQFVDDRGHRISISPVTATSTEITVLLPAEAASGPVWLYIPVKRRLCLTEITLTRSGIPGSIRVGQPTVVFFGLEGGGDCLTIGSPARLHWSAEPPEAEIRIFHVSGATETLLVDALDPTGYIDIDTSSPGSYRYRIEVANPHGSCGTASAMTAFDVRPVTPLFEIVGVELTQAIQIFDLSDPTAETNNSVELIANMDTVVRVYVRTNSATAALAPVTGSLELEGIRYAPFNGMPGPLRTHIEAPRNPLRTATDHSLNFLIPAADAFGSDLRARISVYLYDPHGDYCDSGMDTWSQPISWVNLPALPVTIRRIAESNGGVISEPDALDLIRRAFWKIPSPKTAIIPHPGVFQILPGTTEDNYCRDGGYYQLALSVAYEHNYAEGVWPNPHESSWIGVYMQFGCSADGMMAWPWTSTCISQRNATVAAHELMHTVGLGHTVTGLERCEDIGQPVACHRLPGRPDGRLIQVPFDIENYRASSLDRGMLRAWDLQSYAAGNDRWLSPELWVEGRRLMNTRY